MPVSNEADETAIRTPSGNNLARMLRVKPLKTCPRGNITWALRGEIRELDERATSHPGYKTPGLLREISLTLLVHLFKDTFGYKYAQYIHLAGNRC